MEIANDAASTNTLGTSSRPSAIVGGQIGYNYQFATSYVAGIELDASALPGSGRSSLINVAVPVPGFANTVLSTTSVSTRKDYIGTVRGRIGYTFTPALLVYATGGFAYGGISSNTSTVDGVNPPAGIATFLANGSKSSTLPGYTVGGGLEYLFTPHLSIKAEFLYYDLGSVKYSGGTLVANGVVAAPFTIDSVQTRVRYNGEIARVGLNYHFYADPAPVVARY